ncbi:MAG TPA: diaminobutyrate--2-oxoglutarate transaminase, partial [Gammaproteobacteria bacterium]|nr:diaminobutyrate--2-oxoglutarate transaminase [Gammaproteobacteria bacterium]
MNLDVFDLHESEVRSYCRTFPAMFEKAQGSWLYDSDGKAYLDFFAGASVLNYGHNHPKLKQALLDYISGDGIAHSLDMGTKAKAEFLEAFHKHILEPRGMPHRVQFPGPTGTNSVEAALKLARKVKGREKIISFTNAFHGMTLGALSVTGNAFKRSGAGISLTHSDSMPYCHYFGPEVDTIEYMERLVADSGSGVDLPAGVIVETIQAEGGINVAEQEWLLRLQELCRKHDMLLIVDDIQVGCGRTGPFFSFDGMGLDPDIVCLSKSISGYGVPLAVTLIKPEYDIWEPGEHNGTFRGHNLAFVTGKHALELFWSDDSLQKQVAANSETMRKALQRTCNKFPQARGRVKGRGMLQGIEFENPELARTASRAAFDHGLIVETSGPQDQVLKLLPPLTISKA